MPVIGGQGSGRERRGALIGVYGFQVRRVTHHVILDLDAVAPCMSRAMPRDVESLPQLLR